MFSFIFVVQSKTATMTPRRQKRGRVLGGEEERSSCSSRGGRRHRHHTPPPSFNLSASLFPSFTSLKQRSSKSAFGFCRFRRQNTKKKEGGKNRRKRRSIKNPKNHNTLARKIFFWSCSRTHHHHHPHNSTQNINNTHGFYRPVHPRERESVGRQDRKLEATTFREIGFANFERDLRVQRRNGRPKTRDVFVRGTQKRDAFFFVFLSAIRLQNSSLFFECTR